MKSFLLGSIVSMLLPALAQGIVIRHDRDDAAYRELARGFDCVVRVGGGTGTVVAPEWILTAAHVAESVAVGSELSIGGEAHAVEAIYVHPGYGIADRHRDLGLIRLTMPVDGIALPSLYDVSDEAGQSVIFVGDGYTGDGRKGPSPGERIRRAAQNTIESVRPGWISFLFDAPPAGDELEGISGPGDSGGPALVATDGGWAVVGVSAYNDGEPQCTYGSTEHYSRVSDELGWIRGVMSGELTGDVEPRVMKYETNELGQRTLSREAAATLEADAVNAQEIWRAVGELSESINTGDRSHYLALFRASTIERKRAANDPVDGMFDFMQGVRETRGRITTFHALSGTSMKIPESEYAMRPVVFHLEDGTPGYFGIALDGESKIDHLSLFVQENLCAGGATCSEARPIEDWH